MGTVTTHRLPTRLSYSELAVQLAAEVGQGAVVEASMGYKSYGYCWDVRLNSGSALFGLLFAESSIIARLPNLDIDYLPRVQVVASQLERLQPRIAEWAADYDVRLDIQAVDCIEPQQRQLWP